MVGRAILLDRTSVAELRKLRQLERGGRRLQWDFYAALEQQRGEHASAIQRAILRASTGPFVFRHWQRVVDFNRSLSPLSARGSVVVDPGGRFNIGDIDQSRFPPFPALYVAADHVTALAEKFGAGGNTLGISPNDFALRAVSSYSCVLLSGEIESVLDLREPKRLEPLVDIIKTFDIPEDLPKRAKALDIEDPRLVRSADELVITLTSAAWRVFPMQFDVPSTSQIFGRLAMNAGVEAIVYPSGRTSQACMAVFPHKISGKSCVELDPPFPAEVTHRRLDADTFADFV